MSTKKMQKTLDTVKGDVRELAEAFWAFRDEIMTQQAIRAAESQSPPDERQSPAPADLSPAGHIEMLGSYEMTNGSGNTRVFRWAMDERPVEDVLAFHLDDAAGILAAIGHRQRLAIVLMLLRQAATANEIVAELSLGTTGAAYHHLNVLQRTGLVEQVERGVFSIVPDQVPSLIAIFSGLSGVIRMEIAEHPAAEVPDSAETDGTGEQSQDA